MRHPGLQARQSEGRQRALPVRIQSVLLVQSEVFPLSPRTPPTASTGENTECFLLVQSEEYSPSHHEPRQRPLQVRIHIILFARCEEPQPPTTALHPLTAHPPPQGPLQAIILPKQVPRCSFPSPKQSCVLHCAAAHCTPHHHIIATPTACLSKGR